MTCRPSLNCLNSADDDFFYSVKTNSAHVLQPYLPNQTNIPYRLRTRPNNMTMIHKTKFLNDTDFIIGMLYLLFIILIITIFSRFLLLIKL